MRRQALRWYVDGASYRWIARHLGPHHVTVMNWVKTHADQLSPAPTTQETPLHIVEMDELRTFVGRKKQMVHNDLRRAGQQLRHWLFSQPAARRSHIAGSSGSKSSSALALQ